LRSAYDKIIVEVAEKHAQAIIIAYGFTEFELDSALARNDQTPYEALLEGARKSEMNLMQHLWPMMVETRGIWRQIQLEREQAGIKARL
jgi:acyl-CoA oxidase